MTICVKDKKTGKVARLAEKEANELVAKGQATFVPQFVYKAAVVGIDEATARRTPWPKLKKLIEIARAPKKHQGEEEQLDEETAEDEAPAQKKGKKGK